MYLIFFAAWTLHVSAEAWYHVHVSGQLAKLGVLANDFYSTTRGCISLYDYFFQTWSQCDVLLTSWVTAAKQISRGARVLEPSLRPLGHGNLFYCYLLWQKTDAQLHHLCCVLFENQVHIFDLNVAAGRSTAMNETVSFLL